MARDEELSLTDVAKHRIEDVSENSSSSEINDEKTSWSPNNRSSVMNALYSDHEYITSATFPVPGSPWQKGGLDRRRESQRSYMEDYHDYDAQLEDELHNDEDDDDDMLAQPGSSKKAGMFLASLFSVRGWLNMGAIALLALGLVTIFGALPVITYLHTHASVTQLLVNSGGYNLGGINGSGQVPVIHNLPGLIDPTTPDDVMTRTGFDGEQYNLVFSDEFSVDGRTFWPGDDPYWEAVDLHYWATGDLEWYDPDAISTLNGNLQINITQETLHDLNFRSGMLQSWNKFCFTGGYIEVSLSLPGSPTISGFWPGAWTMGNLGRAGYGASTDGTWPYSYKACDLGTLKNQTNVAGTAPAAALTGNGGGALSYLPGQKLSSCTCSGQEHPGPSVNVGRGAPEIDIIEAQVTSQTGGANRGQASQSAQFAPFDNAYTWATAGATIYNTTTTAFNSYKGGIYQEAVSAITDTDQTAYQATGGNFQKYGFEYQTGTSGSITWSVGNVATWKMNPAAVAANRFTQISQRVISEEPMSINLNLAISASFETVDLAHLVTPNRLLVDYVRVYQRKGQENIGCSPKNFPTEKYINDHLNAFTNPNLTTWAQAGYTFPKNSLEGC